MPRSEMIIFSILISRGLHEVLLTVVTLFYALCTCLIEITFHLQYVHKQHYCCPVFTGIFRESLFPFCNPRAVVSYIISYMNGKICFLNIISNNKTLYIYV